MVSGREALTYGGSLILKGHVISFATFLNSKLFQDKYSESLKNNADSRIKISSNETEDTTNALNWIHLLILNSLP